MFDGDMDEESPMIEDTVLPNEATILEQQFNREKKAKIGQIGQIAVPGIMRTGAQGDHLLSHLL